jgi:hypothetical protein
MGGLVAWAVGETAAVAVLAAAAAVETEAQQQ